MSRGSYCGARVTEAGKPTKCNFPDPIWAGEVATPYRIRELAPTSQLPRPLILGEVGEVDTSPDSPWPPNFPGYFPEVGEVGSKGGPSWRASGSWEAILVGLGKLPPRQ